MKRFLACLSALFFGSAVLAMPAEAQSDIVSVNPGNGAVSFNLTSADETLVLRQGEGATVRYRYIVGEVREVGEVPLAGNLRINAKGGIDIIRVLDLTVPGDVKILAGAGDDQVLVRNPLIAGDLKILGQAGLDTIDVRTATPTPPEEPGEGTATVAIVVPVEPEKGTVGGDLGILAGPDADDVSVVRIEVGDALSVDAGSGPDTDRVRIRQTEVAGLTSVYTQAGDDELIVSGSVFAGIAQFNTATGKDAVRLVDNAFAGGVSARLGARDDSLIVRRNGAQGVVSFNGGSGIDTESIRNNAFMTEDVSIVSFEISAGGAGT